MITVLVLRGLSRRWRKGGEEPEGAVPYGPPAEAGSEAIRMSNADVCAAILWFGVTLYAIFGGADFGAGLWDLLAGSGERARAGAGPDRPVDRARLGGEPRLADLRPGHSLDGLLTAFSAIFTTLYIPLALAALGIVLRGAGFAFRHALPGPVERPASRVFGVASVLTPFFMGTVVGAIASGEVPAGGDGDPDGQLDRLPAAGHRCRSSSWLRPTPPRSSWCATRERPATSSSATTLPVAR